MPNGTQCLLWGRSAGRCQFAGCNRPLWKSTVTQEQANVGQKAHIYGFSSGGPRSSEKIVRSAINNLANLMLVCHQCHRKCDAEQDGGRYSASLLKQMKASHEARIALVTGIAPERTSHILLYGANIGDHSSPLRYDDAALALFPRRYPAADRPIELSTVNSSFLDRDQRFWTVEADELERKFRQRVREPLATRDIGHLSVFALAPQPLLVLLGTLLGDIANVEVYQRHREPSTWAWPSRAPAPKFFVQPPLNTSGTPALVLSLSGTVTADRITSVLGPDVSAWTVTVPSPNNDGTKSRRHLAELRVLLRSLLDRIKAIHGQFTPLHVFPIASVSAAIELGRVRMPKADMPWQVYDQVNDRGGFVFSLSIPGGDR